MVSSGERWSAMALTDRADETGEDQRQRPVLFASPHHFVDAIPIHLFGSPHITRIYSTRFILFGAHLVVSEHLVLNNQRIQ